MTSAEESAAQDFASVRRAVLNRSLLGTVYHDGPLAEDIPFYFHTFTVKLRKIKCVAAERTLENFLILVNGKRASAC